MWWWAIVSILVIFLFKDQIKAILLTFARSKKINALGVNIELGTITDLIIDSQLNQAHQQNAIMKAFQSTIITNEENIIRSQLANAAFTYDKAVDTLIYHLANKNLIIKFLSIDRIIFNEQIQLLTYLNSEFGLLPKNKLNTFYNEWLINNSKISLSEDQFLQYLLSQGLIQEQIGGFSISLLGKEYLNFLVKIGRKFN